MIAFSSVGHIAIRVADMARSLDFYVGKLGCTEMMRLNYADGSLFLLYLRVTDTQYLELFPDGVGGAAPGRETIGLNHLCLTSDDLDRTARELAAAGIALSRPMRTAADGNRQIWIDDPDGVRIEIMEMAPGCLQFEGVRRGHAGTGPVVRTTDMPPPGR